MLQAISDDNKLVTLAYLSKKKIEYVRQNRQFFCPSCHEEVIIKAGNHVIPHFAHQVNSQCLSTSHSESTYHMEGKLLLKDWFKRQQIPVILEPHLKSINQIPDLLITINKKQIAIEFQCTHTAIEAIQKRNSGYKRIGIIPIWFLGKNLFKRKNRLLHINPFTLQFIHQFNETTPHHFFISVQIKSVSFLLITYIFQLVGVLFIQ